MPARKKKTDVPNKNQNRLKVEQWPVSRLVPYARNPRKNDEAVARMVAAIREFGFRIPIVAKEDGTVVDGHLRLKAAISMGLEQVPVALADGLTEAQVKAFRLLANQSASWAEWDMDLLPLELEDLRVMDFDIDLIGLPDELLAPVDAPGNAGRDERANAGILARRFGLAPFSVLNAREGWWQERKRAWIDLGIDSGAGRGGGFTEV